MDERKVIQIISGLHRDGSKVTRVLCNDGTIWDLLNKHKRGTSEWFYVWEQVLGIPQIPQGV